MGYRGVRERHYGLALLIPPHAWSGYCVGSWAGLAVPRGGAPSLSREPDPQLPLDRAPLLSQELSCSSLGRPGQAPGASASSCPPSCWENLAGVGAGGEFTLPRAAAPFGSRRPPRPAAGCSMFRRSLNPPPGLQRIFSSWKGKSSPVCEPGVSAGAASSPLGMFAVHSGRGMCQAWRGSCLRHSREERGERQGQRLQQDPERPLVFPQQHSRQLRGSLGTRRSPLGPAR